MNPDDPPLTVIGAEQARKAGRRVGALGIADAPTFIYCSPFMRCIETATQIALELGVPRILLYPEVGESLMDGFFTKDPRPGLLVRTKDMSNHPVAIEEAAPFQDSPWPENWGQMNRRYKEGIDNLIAQHVINGHNLVIVTHHYGVTQFTTHYCTRFKSCDYTAMSIFKLGQRDLECIAACNSVHLKP